ncbi:hypothetical protein VitviT2T_001605 [Vitis vinifera]|uniref:BHLH domain-containing protein n=2 Tax=Vitis vinifera TaxID=29760 RepID=A0ABY9BHK3_VITVI|nr:basic helix-loop-helix protein 80 [Vitis vinifera]WJZ81785.1 hypothetical protein VitviT2T_001605 [Vitis vinifera]|eukprot:XP_002267465.1 PREDICTED: transcription factor bHLH137 [Vitis vinifera]
MAAFSQQSHHLHPHKNLRLDSTIVPSMSAVFDDEKKPTTSISCFSDDPVKKITHCSSMGAELGAPGMVRKRKKADFEEERDVEEKKGKAEKKRKKKVVKEVPSGFVHVRARRGEATDSHSLAERARREKISERMKFLQSLVPGCDKIIGKTLVLDEIINYVKSLQNQVEFLVGKLASISPMLIGHEANLDSSTLQSENLCSFGPPLPSLLACNSTQLNSYAETSLTSSFSLQQDHLSSVVSQNDGIILWDMDDQEQSLLDQYGFSNRYSF